MFKRPTLVLSIVLLLAGCRGSLPLVESESELYFRDMDIIRMRDMQEIAGLLQEYRYKAGHYPLVKNSRVEQYVYIATHEQRRQIPAPVLDRQVVISCKALERALSDVLQRDIRLPKDPQRLAVYKPTYYLYVTRGRHFRLTAYLHAPCSLTKPVAKFCNQLEISSDPWPPDKIWSPEILTMNPDFVKKASEPLKVMKRGAEQK